MILAGISLNAIVGDNGIITRARKAGDAMERASVQEELELMLIDLQTEKLEQGGEITGEDIKKALTNIKGIEIEGVIGDSVEGEYKNFAFIVNPKDVIINNKISGDKPTGGAINLNEIQGIEIAETVLIQVVGEIKNGTIEKIEAIETENIVYKEDDERNSEASKIYEVSDNGVYHFRITASTGRSYMAEVTVKNAAPLKKDLLTGIGDITEAGYKMIKVKGKTKEVDPTIEEVEKMEMYTLDVIYHSGDLILKNGSFTLDENKQEKAVTVDGLGLSGTTWSVRKSG